MIQSNTLNKTVILMMIMLGVGAGSLAAAAPAPQDPAKAPSETSPLKLIPWPKSVTLGTGTLAIGPASHIAAATPQLHRLAEIFSDNIRMTTGVRLAVVDGPGAAGDIVLAINPAVRAGADILTVRDRQIVKVRDYADHISITDRALVEGWDYRAAAEGTATLLQLLTARGDQLSLPRAEILDWPQADFMSAMVDTARQRNTIEDLKQIVRICRAYKVRYLDLHLTDDQGWTFPSTAFPKLGTTNWGAHGGPAPVRYSLAELKDLVKFADERGVILVPKIEVPGHSSQARAILPEIFGYIDPTTHKPVDQGMMNLTNPRLYPALDTIIGEVMDVFASSPYFDMGFDEVSGLPRVISTPQAKEFMRDKNLVNGSELLHSFAMSINDMVKKRGKKLLQWEGAQSYASPDIIVFTWDSNTREAQRLQAKGIPTITVPWDLGVPWPQWSMFVCNGAHLKRTDTVLGACYPAWEQRGDVHIRWLRRIPTRQERTWGPDNLFTEAGFARRLASTDAVTDRLLYGFSIHYDHPVDANPSDSRFAQATVVTLTPPPGLGTVRFTIDGSEPTATSPALTGGFRITDSITIKARLFDADGKPVAPTWSQPYVFEPLSVGASDLIKAQNGKSTPWFAKTSDVTLASATPGGTIRYTTDGSEPSATSQIYEKSITLNATTTVKARWFDAKNVARGRGLTATFSRLPHIQSAATDKPVTLLVPADFPEKTHVEQLLTNGLLMPGHDWASPEVAHFGYHDMSVVIDLQTPTKLTQVGARFIHCQGMGIFPPVTMQVSISQDGKTFTPLGSAHFAATKDPHDRGAKGKVMEVDGNNAEARYVKIDATRLKLIPEWHPVHGKPAHLMCDEVFVNPTHMEGGGAK